jgi:hypothetical protein
VSPARLLLCAHVSLALLGSGQLAAVASLARRAEGPLLLRLLRNGRLALGLVLLTGAALDVEAGGAWHEQWWFRSSALLLLATGVLLAVAQRQAKAERFRALCGISWLMCGLIGAIATLMELKP